MAIQELAIEYGEASITPYGWTKVNVNLNSQGLDGSEGFGEPTYLFYRRGYLGETFSKSLHDVWEYVDIAIAVSEKVPPLKFRADGTFKILQLADLHFSNDRGSCRDVPPGVSSHNNIGIQMENYIY